MAETQRQKHFVLVHGASHGAWCWYKIRSMLETSSYKVTCLDLKGAGINQSDPDTVLTLEEYSHPLINFMSNLPDKEKCRRYQPYRCHIQIWQENRNGHLCCSTYVETWLRYRSRYQRHKTDPTDNVNLGPTQMWRSTYYCFKKPLQKCTTENQLLTIHGILDVSKDEVAAYCEEGGCADQTRKMLKCLHMVNRHLWFTNNITVRHINDTINRGCETREAFTTKGEHVRGSATKVGREMYMSFITSLTTLALIAMFNK
ncbi:uncharacterized protein LOC107411575 [Ziziphus jujuba]|uniref:Uncharacterized protein LOC107411575 n=1 Tax=Ziziphus jujuba TaxID=326968 RepID=A0A6P3ZB13_ZIZJJ|nr:uncharacterized protein LOC107411575 [Ziziphus jujuba]XP_015874669.3 uncharacterized protein LOC107411575 [Ziziphus jujuba]